MQGQGVYQWTDGVTYQGDFERNRITGTGLYTWADGSTYQGQVVDGLRHGQGTFVWGKPDDDVPMYVRPPAHPSGVKYEGEWANGKKSGFGKMSYDDFDTFYYDGEWSDGQKCGQGVAKYPSGNVYDGEWRNNQRNGKGCMRWEGEWYDGEWLDGKQHGRGLHVWKLPSSIGEHFSQENAYDGEWVNGVRQGFGVFTYAGGARYEGEWSNNMKDGHGVWLSDEGQVYDGLFVQDRIADAEAEEKLRKATGTFGVNVDDLCQDSKELLPIILRHISDIRAIYRYYANLGTPQSTEQDPTSRSVVMMVRMQWWMFVKDCKLTSPDHTLGKPLATAMRLIHSAAKK